MVMRVFFFIILVITPLIAADEQRLALESKALADFERDDKGAGKLLQDARVKAGEGENPNELAAWTVVANALLNLDDTITKN